MNALLVLIGLFIGGTVGIVTAGLMCAASRDDDLHGRD